jgi:hypothetical protein
MSEPFETQGELKLRYPKNLARWPVAEQFNGRGVLLAQGYW